MLTRIFALIAIISLGAMISAFIVGTNVIDIYPTMGIISVITGMFMIIPAGMSVIFAMESHQFGSIS